MLKLLNIKNILLIRNLDLEFDNGLTVLTGETGAGKSILLDALGLTLGSRADFNLIRHGKDNASVTALFNINSNHYIWNLLEATGIERTTELILRRQIYKEGKSIAHINDIPVSLNLLKRCGDALVEIQGQFEGRGLLDRNTHITFLDNYANNIEELKKLNDIWHEFSKVNKKINEFQNEEKENIRNIEWLINALNELKKINPKNSEENELIKERLFYSNLARINQAIQKVDTFLNKDEGLITSIGKIQNILEKELEFSEKKFEPLINNFSNACLELIEAETELSKIKNSLNQNPNKLEEIDERLFEIRNLARKHKVNTNELENIKDNLENELYKIENKDRLIKQCEEKLNLLKKDYINISSKISQKRNEAAIILDKKVKNELVPLKLNDAIFRTSITKLDENQWSKNGWDKVHFQVSTIPGTDCGPIEKISSGGELSRFLLAMKVILSKYENSKTIIFDEVDSGVGGSVAAAVGKRLEKLGSSMQTLVITHSPQVASKGNSHIKISKTRDNENNLSSSTKKLSFEEKVEEIARMLSADKISEQARAAALKLIQEN